VRQILASVSSSGFVLAHDGVLLRSRGRVVLLDSARVRYGADGRAPVAAAFTARLLDVRFNLTGDSVCRVADALVRLGHIRRSENPFTILP
jgi:hypothetical protein